MDAADTPIPLDEPELDETEDVDLNRRGALRYSAMGLAALAVPLAARPGADDPITSLIKSLTGGGSEPAPPAPTPAPAPKPPTKVKSVSPKGKFVKASKSPFGTVDDVPVNGGYLYETDGYVITQPKPGEFVAFDSLCTHEGCPVDGFEKPGEMSCGCHGAQFKLDSGKPFAGPARKPMPMKPVIIENGKIYKAKKAK